MAVDCKKCEFFKITWDKNLPYACKAFGFKSKEPPSIVVFSSAGKECLKYSAKILKKNG